MLHDHKEHALLSFGGKFATGAKLVHVHYRIFVFKLTQHSRKIVVMVEIRGVERQILDRA